MNLRNSGRCFMQQPGEIKHPSRAKQLIDFSGLQYTSPHNGSTITPTDIDGCIEWNDECFIFFEIKLKGKDLPYGQRLALQRLVKSCNKPAVLFIAEHNIENCNDGIDAAKCIVEKYYLPNGWHSWNGKEYTLRQVINSYLFHTTGYKIPKDNQ